MKKIISFILGSLFALKLNNHQLLIQLQMKLELHTF